MRVHGLGFGVWCFGFRVLGVGVWCFGFTGLGVGVWGVGFDYMSYSLNS